MEDPTDWLPENLDGEDELSHYELEYPRTMKLMRKGRKFIVIADDEPYYARVYALIRKHELHKHTWTEEDEEIYRKEIAKILHG